MHYITLEKIAYAIVGDGETRDFTPYRTWEAGFKESWGKPPKLYCDLHFLYRKMKALWGSIIYYFTLPEDCKYRQNVKKEEGTIK